VVKRALLAMRRSRKADHQKPLFPAANKLLIIHAARMPVRVYKKLNPEFLYQLL